MSKVASKVASKATTTPPQKGGTTPVKGERKKTKKAPNKSPKRKATVVKQCLGIDVSKSELQICFRESLSDGQMRVRRQTKVVNAPKGWQLLADMLKKEQKSDAPNGLVVVMEATGVYYENVCYFLNKKGYTINVLLANKAKAFAKSLGKHSKNDKADAQMLAQMGLERTLEAWVAPSDNALRIKHLTRERQGLVTENTAISNQKHAVEAAYESEKETINRYDKRLALIKSQIKEIEGTLLGIVAIDPELKAQVDLLISIPGIAETTALILIAETNNFADFTSRQQLTSYAGYDVIENQSGNRVGKTHISKRGNSRIRAALYFPAITAVQHNSTMKDLCERIVERTKIKMKGYVAVQRKLLLLAFTVCKTNTPFDPQFASKKTQQTTESTTIETQENPNSSTKESPNTSPKPPKIKK